MGVEKNEPGEIKPEKVGIPFLSREYLLTRAQHPNPLEAPPNLGGKLVRYPPADEYPIERSVYSADDYGDHRAGDV